MRTLPIPGDDQRALFLVALRRFFGDFSEAHLAKVLPNVQWLEYGAGELVVEQDTPAGEIFFVVSGRLRVVQRVPGAEPRVLGEMSRGEAVGEIALIARTARTASVLAVRPSVLVRLPKSAFEELLADHPAISMRLAGLIIERLHRANAAPASSARATSTAVISLSNGIDARALAGEIAANLDVPGHARVITESEFARRFDADIRRRRAAEDTEWQFRVSQWLDDLELSHDCLLLAASVAEEQWAKSCIRHADEIMLLADPSVDPTGAVLDSEFMRYVQTECIAVRRLVLVHPRGTTAPRNTAAWLDRMEFTGHVHVRADANADVARLGRIISRSAVGLVLSGGGARGFAHLGVYKALVELGMPIDFVAGTSMGAAVGAMIASEMTADEAREECRRIFSSRLALDFNFLPLISILSGKSVKAHLVRLFSTPDGFPIDIEDTWRNFFCIASSYSHAREVVLRRGTLHKLVRASLSMPVFMPPVIHQSEVLLDGALMNNLPTEEMARRDAGLVIAVDLRPPRFGNIEVAELPGTGRLMLRLFSKTLRRSWKVPYLLDVLYNSPTLHSAARQLECARSADILIQPELGTMGTLEWAAVDRAFEAGYAAARSTLGSLESLPVRRADRSPSRTGSGWTGDGP